MINKSRASNNKSPANNLLARQSSQPHVVGKEYAKPYKPTVYGGPPRAAKSVSRLAGKRAESKLSSASIPDHGIKETVGWDNSIGPNRSS